MAQKVAMPKLGLSMEDGKIVSWLVAEGDVVKKGDMIFEVETEKLSQEVESDYAGTVLKILVPEGETVDCGVDILILGEPGEDISGL
ncbi:MAG: biotin/lipoyl-binding protein [Ruminococcaceae bacterium]|nr:biotin/lipoyl-binding protein [Oscillospiraceae bacterium]